jgi:hypothetical protein
VLDTGSAKEQKAPVRAFLEEIRIEEATRQAIV